MPGDYLWDRSGAPDGDVAGLETLLGPLAHDAPLDEMRLRRPRRSRAPWFVGAGLVVAAAAAVAIYLALPPRAPACSGGRGFAFSASGNVSCDGGQVAAGTLPVGGTLDTGDARATLTIADIGEAWLGTDTVVRLARTDSERHQLVLERGEMHAKVVAPPRLFAVTTPHSEVVDLGCEYNIFIGEDGRGYVSVADGLVEIATKSGSVVTVPEGCRSVFLGPQRPGLPTCTSSTPEVAAAAVKYDHGDRSAADTILARADRRDAVILLALAAVDDERRAATLERLAELSPPPDVGITAESALTDPAHLAAWSTDIFEIYFGLWSPDGGKYGPSTKKP